jgi:hypothetical protein
MLAQYESVAFAIVGIGINVFLLLLPGKSRANGFQRNVIALSGFVMLLCGQYARHDPGLFDQVFLLGVAAIALAVAVQASRVRVAGGPVTD